MGVKLEPGAPLLADSYVGRSKKVRGNRAWLAEQTGVDEETVIGWTKGEEIPDGVFSWLMEQAEGVSIGFLTNWTQAPRSEIPEQWRQALAEDDAARAEYSLPRECESLLKLIEWRLGADQDLVEAESPIVPRLQRLRAAVLEYLAEPLEAGP